jgi:hypothetical protein
MKGVNMKSIAVSAVRSLVIATAVFSTGVAVAQHDAGSRIVVYDDAYSFRGSVYGDLDALEANTRATTPRKIEMDICGTNAVRALKSAVHRFRDLPLLLRVHGPQSAECAPTAQAVRVGQRAGGGPTGIDDAAVADHWRQVMP